MIPILAILDTVEHNERVKREAAEDARLRSLPAAQQDFELRLRQIKAMEAQARVRPVVNVKTTLF